MGEKGIEGMQENEADGFVLECCVTVLLQKQLLEIPDHQLKSHWCGKDGKTDIDAAQKAFNYRGLELVLQVGKFFPWLVQPKVG